MNRYFIGLGSNKHAERHCVAMIEAVMASFSPVYISSVVRTAALGMHADDYLNAVVSFESDLNLNEMVHWCKQLEQKLGRTRNFKDVCEADLDILDPDNIYEPFFQPLVDELQALLSGRQTRSNARRVPLEVSGMVIGLAPCSLARAELVIPIPPSKYDHEQVILKRWARRSDECVP